MKAKRLAAILLEDPEARVLVGEPFDGPYHQILQVTVPCADNTFVIYPKDAKVKPF